MALIDFKKVKQLFGEAPQTADADLFRELFVLVLSRATDADAYTHPAEIASVQAVIKSELGEELSASEVRTAALSKIYESTPLQKCLTSAAAKLSMDQRRAILRGLVAVMHADDMISTREAEFFNMVVSALGLSAADAAGLIVE
ncbi:MAG: TerB family tellurite resistance protein [Congregibacter sp.]|nr:TerB family tellurite resistance protein [Congregibacter sp.]